MQDTRAIQQYVNTFRIYISLYLKPGVGLSCNIYPVAGPGAIVEFVLGKGSPTNDQSMSVSPTVNAALKLIKQNAFGGTLEAFNFRGTNAVMEDNRIIIIKGDDAAGTWDSEAAREDVGRVVSLMDKSPK